MNQLSKDHLQLIGLYITTIPLSNLHSTCDCSSLFIHCLQRQVPMYNTHGFSICVITSCTQTCISPLPLSLVMQELHPEPGVSRPRCAQGLQAGGHDGEDWSQGAEEEGETGGEVRGVSMGTPRSGHHGGQLQQHTLSPYSRAQTPRHIIGHETIIFLVLASVGSHSRIPPFQYAIAGNLDRSYCPVISDHSSSSPPRSLTDSGASSAPKRQLHHLPIDD